MRDDDPRPRITQLRVFGMDTPTIAARLSLEGWSEAAITAALLPKSVAPAPSMPESAPSPSAVQSAAPQVIARSAQKRLVLAALAALAFAAFGYAIYSIRPSVVYSISVPSYQASSTPILYGAWPSLSDPEFYSRVKGQFVAEKASFIEADLETMMLTVYREGAEALRVPIMTKGREGSWWETPVGVYKVETRERDHFSSFGSVHMPYSLAFNGNFFIHGWPVHPDGTPVDSSYSGGCIRLSTEDAAKVFALTEMGMPVLVYERVDTSDAYAYYAKGPAVPAKEYLVADIKNGTVLMHKSATTTLPIASVTKLVTALVVIENFNLDKTIYIPSEVKVTTTVPRLKAGEAYSVHDLLILMLTESSNEAAETFAHSFGYGRFVELMNAKVAAIGLTHTTFADPSGFSPENRSTPEDLFTLLKHIYENRRFVFDITSDSVKADAYGAVVWGTLGNFNRVPSISNGFVGGKIGRTDEARETYAGVFLLKTKEGERPIAIVALGSPDVQADVRTLLRSVSALYGAN